MVFAANPRVAGVGPVRADLEANGVRSDLRCGRRRWLAALGGAAGPPRLVVACLDGSRSHQMVRAASLVARRHAVPLVVVEVTPGAFSTLRRSPVTRTLTERVVSRVFGAAEVELDGDTLSQMGLAAPHPSSGLGALTLDDLGAVVGIHMEAFPDSAMTHLGPKVVERYYRWQFIGDHPAPHATGCWSDGELVGFLFGGARHDAVSGFARRFLLTVVLGAVTHPGGARRLAGPKVGQVLRLMFRRRPASDTTRRDEAGAPVPSSDDSATPRQGDGAEKGTVGVLSIAVRPLAQGSGAATALLGAAEAAARDQGADGLHLTVDTANARAVRFYEREGWERVVGDDGTWHGKMRKALGPAGPEPQLGISGSQAVG